MRDVQQRRSLTTMDLCNMMGLHRKQKQLCRRGHGVAETLVRATRLSAVECGHQFRHERWNCTLGKFRIHILEKGTNYDLLCEGHYVIIENQLGCSYIYGKES